MFNELKAVIKNKEDTILC